MKNRKLDFINSCEDADKSVACPAKLAMMSTERSGMPELLNFPWLLAYLLGYGMRKLSCIAAGFVFVRGLFRGTLKTF